MATPYSRSSQQPSTTDERFSELELLAAKTTPAGWAWLVDGRSNSEDPERGWRPYPHLLLISDLLMRVAAGKIRRLLVTTPPRHGKSNLISRATPAWYLGQHPARKVIMASNTAMLAEDFSRQGRDDLRAYGPHVFNLGVSQDAQSAARWETTKGGVVIAAGIGGQITGRGAHLLIVDDPVKTAQEAASEVVRQSQWDWWRAVVRTRLMKDGAIVLVMTRWHEDDLASRLIAQARDNEEAEPWTVVNLPALWEPDEELGELVDPMGREPGEALCPGLIPYADLVSTRAELGSYFWSALYQGRPRPAEGMMFKRDQMRRFTIREPTEIERNEGRLGLYVLQTPEGPVPVDVGVSPIFQTVDTASSEKEMADFSVVATWAVTPTRDLLLLDIQRQRFEDPKLGEFVTGCYNGALGNDAWVDTIVQAKRPVRISVENASSGPKVIRELTDHGYPVTSSNPDTDKVMRALLAIARYEAGKVYHLQGAPWLRAFEDELTSFPHAAHDDQVDVVSMAAIELPRIPLEARRQKDPGQTRAGGIRQKKF